MGSQHIEEKGSHYPMFLLSLPKQIHPLSLILYLNVDGISSLQHFSDSFAGPVWGLAADVAGNSLAAACEDGLRLFDISSGDIQFKKAMQKAGKGAN